MLMYGKMKNVSKFRPFGRQAYVNLNEDQRGKGKQIAQAVEAVNFRYAIDLKTCSYKVLRPKQREANDLQPSDLMKCYFLTENRR